MDDLFCLVAQFLSDLNVFSHATLNPKSNLNTCCLWLRPNLPNELRQYKYLLVNILSFKTLYKQLNIKTVLYI